MKEELLVNNNKIRKEEEERKGKEGGKKEEGREGERGKLLFRSSNTYKAFGLNLSKVRPQSTRPVTFIEHVLCVVLFRELQSLRIIVLLLVPFYR